MEQPQQQVEPERYRIFVRSFLRPLKMKNEKNDLKATDIPGHARASRSILSSFLPSRSVYIKKKKEKDMI